MRRWPRRTLFGGLALIVAAACGCTGALHGPALDSESRREHYLEQLSKRESAAASLEAEASLWLSMRSSKPIPGVLADLALGAPDAFRLRVHSPLGTVLDLGGRGSMLIAAMPSNRAYVEEAAAAESLGIKSPAALVVRVCAASWRPPENCWRDATWSGTQEILRWIEGGDSIRVAIDVAGLPTQIDLERGALAAVRVRYLEWSRGSPAWPAHVEIEDGGGGARLTCRLERVRARSAADSSRLAVKVPSGATRLEWSEALRAATQAIVP